MLFVACTSCTRLWAEATALRITLTSQPQSMEVYFAVWPMGFGN